jgi:hypothetical protein
MEDKKYSKLKASFEATQPQMPVDFTDRVMKRIEQPVHASSHRRLWPYAVSSIAAAACIALLFYVGGLRNTQHNETPHLVAQTDTAKTVPQAENKKVEEHQQKKQENVEKTDTVKMMKQKFRMPRTPKHYMAKAETVESTPEPELIDATELAERAFAEEKSRMEMEMMARMQGSLQADFKGLTDEIRQRGERMSQHVVMALNEDE